MSLWVDYNKNVFASKAKIPPITKNGPNGIYFWRLIKAHNIPATHAITSANPKPFAPSHMPPTPISFISPRPIGGNVSGFFLRICQSNINPTNADIKYPNVAPIAASVMVVGQLKNAISNNPDSINGNKYASGIIRRRKSATEINIAHIAAHTSKPIKKIFKNIFFPLAFRIGLVLYLLYNITRIW